MADRQAWALVRQPGPLLAEGIVTHIERAPLDLELARKQWLAYVDALRQFGFRVAEVAPAPACPDAVFVEDAVVVCGSTAVLARSGAEARRAEVAGAEDAVRRFGYRVLRIEAPGTLDGGDVLKVGRTVYVGLSGRTNASGIAQLRAAFEPEDVTVVAVPTTKVLHLKSAVTALPDGTVIGWLPAVDDPSAFPTFVAMPEEGGAHVVVLDETHVLISADCPQSVDLLRQRGLTPVVVDICEFVKLEGCVTCLSVRLRTPPTAPAAA